MAEKKTELSIVIRTVDAATAKLKAINASLDQLTKPVRDFKSALGDLSKKSGLDDVIGGFKGVGNAIGELLSKVAMIGGVVGLAVAGVMHLVDEYDDLGKKAERLGVGVDFLARLRYAAEKTGVPVEALDESMQSFSQNMGQVRAHTGRLYKFLGQISPELQRQVLATKDTTAAYYLMADAMAKVTDPAKRAALAQKAVGDSILGPMLHLGAKGIKTLGARYSELAGSQAAAAAAAEDTHDAMIDLHAAADGVKASLVEGLAPALTVIIKQITEWLSGHQAEIKEWAKNFGDKLPGAFNTIRDAIGEAYDKIAPFFDSTTKLKIAAAALAAVIVGPLVSALVTLGVALVANPIMLAIAAIAAGAYLIIFQWDKVTGFFDGTWEAVTGKFRWAASLIKIVLWPFIGLPMLIIGGWSGIKNFFGGLWDGITGVFQAAWGIIKDIVDKVVGAVDTIKNAITGNIGDTLQHAIDVHRARDTINALPGGNAASDAAASPSPSAAAKIIVDFANAPRGTRVSVAPQSTADVDLNVGYLMGAFL